ncbi:hypothetical protein CDAR_241071 [Caerostris darwini]|uniref:Uncharacterized protein n=1 Tax=Caerostris darwini TaxID=1538125 RepID=A0AAV4TFC8_9ARAC|nr:hypothetical protein CDAR_241071 [Caerostris darwini]
MNDLPSYQKPSFPSCPSNTPQGSGSRRRRDGKGIPNELSSLTHFSTLSEKYGESSETTDKGDNKEPSEEKR